MRNTIILADPSDRKRTELRRILGEPFQIREAGDISQCRRLLDQNPDTLAAVILGCSMLSCSTDGGIAFSEYPQIFSDVPVFALIDDCTQEDAAVLWGADHAVRYPFRPGLTGKTVLNTISLYNHKWSLEKIVEEQKNALHNSKDILVDTLSTIIECRSVESGQHVLRIRSFTAVLLREVSRCCPEYSLDNETISKISDAADMHDICKISIPDAILNKPGRLTDEEFAVMKTHAAAGSEIIERMAGMGNEEYLRYAYNICLYHHERWDGGGYPMGLSGENIPICAQVVGIADAYDALTTKRAYKEACSCEHAVNMILSGECGAFSPKLLECFRHVSEDFASLAKQYADGGAVVSERIREPLAPPGRTAANSMQGIMNKYEILLQHIGALVIEFDLDNNTIHNIFDPDQSYGYLRNAQDPTHAMEMLAENAVHPDDRVMLTELFSSYLEMFLASGLKKSVRRYRMKERDGIYRTCNVFCYRLEEEGRRVLGVWEKAPEELSDVSRDSLTRLFNKETAQRLTEEHLAEDNDRLSALAIIDLDNFKNVNDRYGHLFGDEVLALIAQKLSSLFRSTDVVARIGGDEFLVFMPNIPKVDPVLSRCRTLIDSIPEMFEGQLRDSGLSCSVGIALTPDHGTVYQDLFRHADTALYRAKHLGKNQCILYEPLFHMPAYPSQVSQRIDSDEQPQWTENNLPFYVFDALYESGNMEDTINHLLAIVGQQTNVSRVYIFENNTGNTACSNTFEWCREGVSAEKDNLQNVSYVTDIPGYEKNFNEQGIFYCSDVNKLPPHIRLILEPQGIRSMLQCAIRDNGVFKGYVGFDDNINPRLWTREQIDLLTFLSRIISIFVLKHRVQEATSKMASDLREILNHQYAWLYIIDPETYEIRFFNERTQKLVPGISDNAVCYKTLLGKDAPCENCPIRNHGRTVIENYYLGLRVEAVASPIHWESRAHWLITCRELDKSTEI
ncbi:MAG: diguanylate cyclase [Clostridia bacterium]|nr:diguanylate cyclase [Clostridia bacterium]